MINKIIEFFKSFKFEIRLKHLATTNKFSLILLFMVSIHHIANGMHSIDPTAHWIIPWVFALSLELAMFNNSVARGIRFLEMKKNKKKNISDMEKTIEGELNESFKMFKSVNFVSNFYYALYAATTSFMIGSTEIKVLDWNNFVRVFEAYSTENLFVFVWSLTVVFLAYKWAAMIPAMIVSQSSTMPIFQEFAEKEEKKLALIKKKTNAKMQSNDNRDITSSDITQDEKGENNMNTETMTENHLGQQAYTDQDMDDILDTKEVPDALISDLMGKTDKELDEMSNQSENVFDDSNQNDSVFNRYK